MSEITHTPSIFIGGSKPSRPMLARVLQISSILAGSTPVRSTPYAKYPPPAKLENAERCSVSLCLSGDNACFQSSSFNSCLGGVRLRSKKRSALLDQAF